VIELSTSAGSRRLKLGPDFRVARSAALHAELDALLGQSMLAEAIHAREAAEPAATAI